MSPCNDLNLMRYIDHDLVKNKAAEMEQHLSECEKCRIMYRQLLGVDNLLTTQQRDKAPALVYRAYKQELSAIFVDAPWWKQYATALVTFLRPSTHTWVRIAQAAALLIIGIALGRISLQQPFAPQPPYTADHSQTITPTDVAFMQDYFNRTESLLLAIKNSSGGHISAADIAMQKEIAQNLLSQKPLIDQAELGQGEAVLEYLDQLEMILLEISNGRTEQISTTILTLKEIVREANLVQTTRQLQRRVAHGNSQV